MVDGIVCVCLVCFSLPLWSLGSFWFVWFVLVRPVCRWVLWCSSGSSGCTLVGHWVISDSSASSSCALGVAGFVRDRLVRPGAP